MGQEAAISEGSEFCFLREGLSRMTFPVTQGRMVPLGNSSTAAFHPQPPARPLWMEPTLLTSSFREKMAGLRMDPGQGYKVGQDYF